MINTPTDNSILSKDDAVISLGKNDNLFEKFKIKKIKTLGMSRQSVSPTTVIQCKSKRPGLDSEQHPDVRNEELTRPETI